MPWILAFIVVFLIESSRHFILICKNTHWHGCGFMRSCTDCQIMGTLHGRPANWVHNCHKSIADACRLTLCRKPNRVNAHSWPDQSQILEGGPIITPDLALQPFHEASIDELHDQVYCNTDV